MHRIKTFKCTSTKSISSEGCLHLSPASPEDAPVSLLLWDSRQLFVPSGSILGARLAPFRLPCQTSADSPLVWSLTKSAEFPFGDGVLIQGYEDVLTTDVLGFTSSLAAPDDLGDEGFEPVLSSLDGEARLAGGMYFADFIWSAPNLGEEVVRLIFERLVESSISASGICSEMV
jgi:hypothetical protein